MQFIFGDNTTKYTLLFFDDKAENAAKMKDMVRLPYSPNPQFESLGFIPFGNNNNRSLFFHFQKDTKMARNVYILHGVYDEYNPEYFFGKEYVSGIFTRFIDQNRFDALRDDLLAGKKDCTVEYAYDQALAQTPVDSIPVDPLQMTEILAKLYQRSNVLLVMDDEQYQNDTVRLLLKKIFHYLTPSLRKVCSYITAVDQTGDMDFLLRIIPRSMLQKNQKAIDLSAPAQPYTDKSGFVEIVQYLLGLSESRREELFSTFELLYYGRETIYKKQNFQKFFRCYVADVQDLEWRDACDELLSSYFLDSKCAAEPVIPEFLQTALKNRYSSVAYLDSQIDWDKVHIEEADRFYAKSMDLIKKVYFLWDAELTYFETRFKERFESPVSGSQIGTLKKWVTRLPKIENQLADSTACEARFLTIALHSLQHIQKLCNAYDNVLGEILTSANRYIQKNFTRQVVENRSLVVLNAMNPHLQQLEVLKAYITDVREHTSSRITRECVNPHNDACIRREAEERSQQERAYRVESLELFVSKLRAEEEAYLQSESEHKKAKSGKAKADSSVEESGPENPTDIETQTPDMEVASVTVTLDGTHPISDINALLLEAAAQSSTLRKRTALPTAGELRNVCDDSDLQEQLVDAVVAYYGNVCLPQGEAKLTTADPYLKLVQHHDTLNEIVRRLIEDQHIDLAVLYLATYETKLDVAMRNLLKLKSVAELDSAGLTLVKRMLPPILLSRSESAILSPAELAKIAEFAKEIRGDKESSKQQKAICNIILSLPVMSSKTALRRSKTSDFHLDEPGEKGNKLVWLLSICLGGIILLLIIVAIVLAIALNGGGKDSQDKDDDSAGKPKVTTVDKASQTTIGETDTPTVTDSPEAGAQ